MNKDILACSYCPNKETILAKHASKSRLKDSKKYLKMFMISYKQKIQTSKK